MTDYNEKFCGCKDASMKNRCRGLPNCYLRPGHPERLHPPTVEIRKASPRSVPACVWFSVGFSVGVILAEGLYRWYA